MADTQISGSGPPFDPRRGKAGRYESEGQGNENTTDKTATEALSKEGNMTAKPDTPVATGGAVHSDSAQSQPGKETIAMSLAGKQSSPEVKPASPEAKAANSPASGDKSGSSSSTKPPEAARTDVGNASKALPNASLENLQPTQKKTYSETGSQLASGKVQDTSASTTADRPGLKQQQSETRQNEPLGQSGRQSIEPHAPPAQAAKAQENTYQKDNTYQNQKITNYEPKLEPKSASIPPPVIIPADIHQTQKNQNPASPTHQPETAPVKPLQDSVPKIQDAKNLPTDTPKQNPNDGKPGPEVAQAKNTEPPRSHAGAGELGSNDSAGRDGKLVSEPNLSEATTKHGEPKSDVARGEQTVKDATHKAETQQPSKEIRVDTTDSLTDRNNIFIDKNTKTQVEGTRDTAIGNRAGEAATGNRDGKQEPPGKDKNADMANKPETRLPGNDVSSASVGASFDGRPGRVNDKSGAAEPVERIILRVENLAFNLADKGTVAKLLGVLEQIKTGKVTATDPESTAFAHAVLSTKETNLGKIEAALKASDNALLNSILSDKLTPEQAEYQKLARWELPKEREKTAKLEAENQELKRDRNFLQGFIASVKNLFADFIQGRKPLEPDASAAEIIDEITIEANNKNAVEQFMSRTQNQLAKYEAGEDVEPIDAEDVPAVASSPKPNQQKITRDTHVVETLSNCEEIALLKLGKSELGELLAQINQIESTLIDDRPKRRDLLPGEVLYLPTKQEIQAVLDPPKPGAAT